MGVINLNTINLNGGSGGGSAEGAVKYTEAQSLTDAQKTQARTNIGAASDAELTSLEQNVGDLADLDTTDKSSVVNAINEVVQGVGATAVLYTEQSLTDAQKGQARENIGAASESDIVVKAGGGVGSTVQGERTTAEGDYSHAEGYVTTAEGDYSHAEGYVTTAGGLASSHAEGSYSTASGDASHAEGYGTMASGDISHAEGQETRATNPCEHAEGRYNKSNTGNTDAKKTCHSVGIGTHNNNRKNAHEIMANGDHYVLGVGGYDGTNPATNGVKTLQDVIDGKADKTAIVSPASASSYAIEANKQTRCGTLAGNTTFTLAPYSGEDVAEYDWTFTTPSTAPTITFPSGITWAGGSAPTINASKTYEINIVNGLAIAVEF